MTAKIRIGLVISGLLTAALVTWWSWYQSTVANPYRPDHLIRFHVIANSDSAADQALKFRVRDVIVQAMAPRFRQAKNIEEAREIAQANLGYMEQLAKQEICAAGKDYPVAVYLGHFQFPEKTYHLATAGTPGERTSLTLPAGEYEAVRVVIGRGTGANWWCVLFPPLCFVNLQNPMPDKKRRGLRLTSWKVRVRQPSCSQKVWQGRILCIRRMDLMLLKGVKIRNRPLNEQPPRQWPPSLRPTALEKEKAMVLPSLPLPPAVQGWSFVYAFWVSFPVQKVGLVIFGDINLKRLMARINGNCPYWGLIIWGQKSSAWPPGSI